MNKCEQLWILVVTWSQTTVQQVVMEDNDTYWEDVVTRCTWKVH